MTSGSDTRERNQQGEHELAFGSAVASVSGTRSLKLCSRCLGLRRDDAGRKTRRQQPQRTSFFSQTDQQRRWTRLSWHDYHKQGKQGLEGEAGAGRKWHQPDGRRAGDHVGAGAEPAPPGPDQGGDPAAEAAAAHPEEPRLRRQLPGEARHPEGRAGEAEVSAAAGGGQAGHGERQHEGGAGRSALKVRGPAELRQDCGPQPRHLGQGAPGLRHRAPHPG